MLVPEYLATSTNTSTSTITLEVRVKSEYQKFSTRVLWVRVPSMSTPACMNGGLLCPTLTTVYLGITLYELQWNHHIDHIGAAAKRVLGFLWHTMHKCLKVIKGHACKTMVWSKLKYCASIWDPHNQKCDHHPLPRWLVCVSVEHLQDLDWEPQIKKKRKKNNLRRTSFYTA